MTFVAVSFKRRPFGSLHNNTINRMCKTKHIKSTSSRWSQKARAFLSCFIFPRHSSAVLVERCESIKADKLSLHANFGSCCAKTEQIPAAQATYYPSAGSKDRPKKQRTKHLGKEKSNILLLTRRGRLPCTKSDHANDEIIIPIY